MFGFYFLEQMQNILADADAKYRVGVLPYAGQAVTVSSYDVIVTASGHDVSMPSMKWVAAEDGILPCGAIEAGADADGNPLYVARTTAPGSLIVGALNSMLGGAYVPYEDQKEHKVTSYEALVVSASSAK